jgi:hypothetical protein
MGRAVKALIALLAGMLVLSGCSGQNPSHAATVGGVVIPVSEVDALTPVVKPYLPSPTPASVAGLLVLSRLGVQVAANAGLTFSDDERAAASAAVLPEGLAADPAAAGFVADFLTTALASQALGQEGFAEAAASIPVEVNPRFGEWSLDQLTLVPGGSLSSPAPAGGA